MSSSNPIDPESIRTLADWMMESDRIVAFTGAGVSTESGIPDFRSPTGFWAKFKPVMFQDFVSDRDARVRSWEFNRPRYKAMREAEPNSAHLAFAELERMGKLDCVVTQNIDKLHQRAGNSPDRIIELHGTLMHITCISCSRRYEWEEILPRLDDGDDAPECECGGMLKPATVSFGQAMPAEEMLLAERAARESDLFIVLGSSLVVFPAAQFPQVAKDAGARLAILNFEPTPQDCSADLVIHGSVGEIMGRVMEQVGSQTARHGPEGAE